MMLILIVSLASLVFSSQLLSVLVSSLHSPLAEGFVRETSRARLSSTGGSAVSRSPDLGSALDVERVVGVRANDARATNARHARASNARVRASYVAVYARARERERAIRSQRLVAI
jgi:hypothetical protein